MVLSEIYNIGSFWELQQLPVKPEASLEFYSCLTFAINSIDVEDRVNSYRELERVLKYYYSKYKVNLKDKIKNKKYMTELFEKINKKEKTEIELLLDEIPEF